MRNKCRENKDHSRKSASWQRDIPTYANGSWSTVNKRVNTTKLYTRGNVGGVCARSPERETSPQSQCKRVEKKKKKNRNGGKVRFLQIDATF